MEMIDFAEFDEPSTVYAMLTEFAFAYLMLHEFYIYSPAIKKICCIFFLSITVSFYFRKTLITFQFVAPAADTTYVSML